MEMNNIITFFAIAAIAIAAVNISVTYMKISEFNEEVTGNVAGYVNITIDTVVAINLTNNQINFSNGNVAPGEEAAFLWTNGEATASIVNGNWSDTAYALIVMNIGTVNASINISTAQDASDFIGTGTVTSEYKWNVTDKEVGSCSAGSAGAQQERLGEFAPANKTVPGLFCGQFSSLEAHNEIYLDVNLTIPYDSSNTGVLADTITIEANAAL